MCELRRKRPLRRDRARADCRLEALIPCAAFVAAALAPRPADACSPAECVDAIVLPGEGAVVPANLPGLRLVLGDEPDAPLDYWSDSMWPEAWTFAVEAADGTPIPLRKEGSNLFFETPLQPDREYVVRVDADAACSRISPYRFRTVASAPLPTALGRVVAGGMDEGRSDGSCVEEGRWLEREVHLRLDPSAEPWADALEVRFTVADARAPSSDFLDRFESEREGRFTRSLSVECPDTINFGIGADTRVPGGVQPTRAVGHIAGAWTATTAALSVDYDCGYREGGCRGTPADGLPWLLLVPLWALGVRRARSRLARPDASGGFADERSHP